MAHTRRQAGPESVDQAFDGLGPRRHGPMNRSFEPPPGKRQFVADVPAWLGLRPGRHRAGRVARSPLYFGGCPRGRHAKTGGSLARGDQPTAPADQGQAGDPPLHGRWAVAVRELRLQARLKQLHGKPFPESFTRGQQLAQLQNMVLHGAGPCANSTSTASRARRSPTCSRTSPASPIESASSAR